MPRRSRPTSSLRLSWQHPASARAAGRSPTRPSRDGTNTVVQQVTVQQRRADRTRRRRSRSTRSTAAPTTASSRSPSRRGRQPRRSAAAQAQQAQGSGWVYDSDGRIVTNEHVVDGATSISVSFWNGKTYKATRGRHRPVDRPRGDQGRRALLGALPAHRRRLDAARRSVTASSRSAAPSGSRRRSRAASSARCTARSRRRPTSPSTTRSRPTPRSTTATRAARC